MKKEQTALVYCAKAKKRCCSQMTNKELILDYFICLISWDMAPYRGGEGRGGGLRVDCNTIL